MIMITFEFKKDNKRVSLFTAGADVLSTAVNWVLGGSQI